MGLLRVSRPHALDWLAGGREGQDELDSGTAYLKRGRGERGTKSGTFSSIHCR